MPYFWLPLKRIACLCQCIARIFRVPSVGSATAVAPIVTYSSSLGEHAHGVIILLVILHNNLLLLHKVLPAQRAAPLALQPRPNALQVELVTLVARQLDDEAVLVVEEPLGADGAALVVTQLLPRHALEPVEELLRHAAHVLGRVEDVGLEGGDELGQEVAVLGGGRGGGQRLHLLLHEAQEA